MERGSDKHTPRIDEELDDLTKSLQRGSPVESHVEEFRQQETADDDEPAGGVAAPGNAATDSEEDASEATEKGSDEAAGGE